MKKRIFVDAHVFDGGFQGSRSFIKGIYTELLNHPDLEISFAGRNREALEAAFPHPRARFLPLTSNSSTRRLAWELPRLLRKNHFDYAHFQYIIPPVPTCPLIVTIHDVLFDDFPALFSPSYRLAKHMLYRYAAQKADVLTTVSDHSAQSIRKNLGVKNKIVMTPNGISQDFFDAYDKEAIQQKLREAHGFDRYILYVSRMEPRKNHALLLETFLELELHWKGYHLVLIGTETLPVKDFQRTMAALEPGVRNHVHVLPDVSEMDLISWYRGASAFVYPSAAEGFGIPPLEAAAAAIPVLCSNAAALQEYSFFGKWHFDPADRQAFAKKLLAILNDPPTAEELETRSQYVRAHYNWKIAAANLLQAIHPTSPTFNHKPYDQLQST